MRHDDAVGSCVATLPVMQPRREFLNGKENELSLRFSRRVKLRRL